MRRCVVVALAILSVLACAPDQPDLALTAKAADSLTVAFADSAFSRIPARPAPDAPIASDSLHACDDAAIGDFVDVRVDSISLALPSDFKAIDPARRNVGFYRWVGSDKSTLVVRPGTPERHSGWTGLLTTECTVDIAQASAHIDLADATVQVPDHVVHAVLERPGMVPIVFEAHARSIRRQAELLHTLRSLSIAEGHWIPKP